MKAPTCHLPSRSIARIRVRWSRVLVGCAFGFGALSCADDPGIPSPLDVQQMANGTGPANATTGTPTTGAVGGDPSADPGSATAAANGDPNGAALGVNPAPPPPPNMVLLPPRTTSTSEQDPATEPTTDTEPSTDTEEMPAGAEPGGFFGSGSGDDTAADDTAGDTTDPPADTGTGTGATFGGGFAGTPTTPAPAAMTCTPLAVGLASGDIGGEAKCFTVMGTLQGWQVSNLGMRSLTVNDAPATPPMLPAASNGGYTFAFGAGDPTYTAFSTW